MKTISDTELVTQYIQGDENCLSLLLNRHKDKIFGYIMSKIKNEDLANDVFQDTFIKAIIYMKEGRYNEEGKFIQWIMRIAHNLVVDHFRANKKMRTISETFFQNESTNIFDYLADENNSFEDKNIKEQIEADLVSILQYLPEDQKQVIHMRLFCNLSFKEISEETGVSINTALGRMRYAIINIRKLIEQHNIILA